MTLPLPQAMVRYTDENGRLSPEGLAFLLELIRQMEDRLKALEAS